MTGRFIPPPHSDSMRFVAQASRPGSIESRHIHGCTCADDLDRGHSWNQERVWEWQGSISLGCPAHGRLLEQHLEQVNASMRHAQNLTMDALDPSMGSSYPPSREDRHDGLRDERGDYRLDLDFMAELSRKGLPRRRSRSFSQRVVDALQGFARGWRGV